MGAAPHPKAARASLCGDDGLSIGEKATKYCIVCSACAINSFHYFVPHSRCLVQLPLHAPSVRRERHRPDTLSVIGKFQ